MRKKILFIDRDGTIIKEPEDEQIDALEKLEMIPGVIRNLYKIKTLLGYELVMVSNQDGLGGEDYTYEKFEMVQEKLITLLKNEGIEFKEVLIDNSFANNPSPCRKPSPKMVQHYLTDEMDYEKSAVAGDRKTDIQLADNMGVKGIFLTGGFDQDDNNNSDLLAKNWDEIYQYLSFLSGAVERRRTTRETDILVKISNDGLGESEVTTGLGFFDHMIDQIARHSGLSIKIKVKGDLYVDEHHTIEDTALTVGEALVELLGKKTGMNRFGFTTPMDDALATIAVDMGGRPHLVWNVEFKREKVGDVPTEMISHFFKSFSDAAKCNIHVNASGENDHHKIESIFKCFGRALSQAIKTNSQNFETVPSTKGIY